MTFIMLILKKLTHYREMMDLINQDKLILSYEDLTRFRQS